LGVEGISIFRTTIDKNNSTLRDKFFSHYLVKALWPFIKKNLTYDHCFGNAPPNTAIKKTYRVLATILSEQYELELPSWWYHKCCQ
jgi:hypothetical protein